MILMRAGLLLAPYRRRTVTPNTTWNKDAEGKSGGGWKVNTLLGTPPGQTIRVTLQREGRQRELAVQVGRRPGTAG